MERAVKAECWREKCVCERKSLVELGNGCGGGVAYNRMVKERLTNREETGQLWQRISQLMIKKKLSSQPYYNIVNIY